MTPRLPRFSPLLVLLILPVAFGDDTPPADLAAELPRIPALSPAEAVAAFQIHPGFRVEAIAVEPVVTNPVSVAYDSDGRLYVAEMRGYPYPEKSPTGHVTRLTDSDGDGRFDRRTIFVDGLSWPTSVLPYRDGVLVAVAPDILFAKDTNGDGVADVRTVLFSGFGTQNVQGLLNGLAWGLDGWVYGSSGSNGGEIRLEKKPGSPTVSVRGRDFRFKADGSAFEAISGGGQFGHGFDDWGHRFVCNNSNQMRQIILPSESIERNRGLIVSSVLEDIAVEGGAGPVFRISPAEPWRVVRTRQRKADPGMSKRLAPTELFATGFFTSATGVTIYRGTAYPPEYHGNAFIGDVGGNLVHRKIVEKSGAIFSARRADIGREFLASRDNWFRPVNFANTPNGTLLVIDMYRETIEHPASIPEPIKKHLDLTSGRDKGRLYEIVPEAGVTRKHPSLSKATTGGLVGHLADPDAWWRETAQRLLLERRDPSSIPMLREMVKNRPTALGRLHALWTLRGLDALESASVELALTDPEPGVRENGAKLAEAFVAKDARLLGFLLKLAEDPDAMVRFQTAFALGALNDPIMIEALATIAESEPKSPWVRAAVLSSISGKSLDFLDALAARRAMPEEFRAVWVEELTTLVGVEATTVEVARLVKEYVARPSFGGTKAALLGLGKGLKRSGRSLRDIHEKALDVVFEGAARVAVGQGPPEARIEAVRLLGLSPKSQAVDILPKLLEPREPVALQVAAIQALGEFPGVEAATILIDQWKSMSPLVRREAMELLFSRPERLKTLLKGLESGKIVSSDLELSRRVQLLNHPSAEIRAEAERRLGTLKREDRSAVIAAFLPALKVSGDVEKGRAVFKKACATCHKAEGAGLDVGPNLATVAGRTPEDLLTHILDPNREVASNYVSYNVALDDGRVVSGMIAEESANALTLKRAEGAGDVVPRGRIEKVVSSGLSLMPEGLEKDLKAGDFADLIAYIRGLTPSSR